MHVVEGANPESDFVCNVKHGLWGTRLSTISVWLRVSLWLWWFKQVRLGPSDNAVSSPPACGRGSAPNWHAPSVSQQREVLVFPRFWDLILYTWQFSKSFKFWLSGQRHMSLWCDELMTQIYFCFTRTLKSELWRLWNKRPFYEVCFSMS